MDLLELRNMDYIIAIKMYPTLKLSIRERVRWYEGEAGVQLGEFWYTAEDWPRARRIVVVRQHIKVRPKAVGKLLFPDEEVYHNYRYSAFVTNLKSSAELVWELYRRRADCENRIKELGYDFGADNFGMQEFYATVATLRTVMIGYDLMALFRLTVLQTKHSRRLTTTRLKCLSIGSWLVKSGRNDILKMSAAMKNRQWMDFSLIHPTLTGIRPPY